MPMVSLAKSTLGQLIADNPELLLDVVQQDMGVALLPMFSALDAVQNGRLCHILPEWRSPDIEFIPYCLHAILLMPKHAHGWIG